MQAEERERLVAETADLIEAQYVFPDVAARVAAELRARPIPATDDPAAVGTELTRWLRERDGHFKVRRGEAAVPRRSPPDAEALRRDNYGFREVRVDDDNAAYLRITRFCGLEEDRVEAPAARAAADAALTLCANADRLTLDVRGNGGGSPTMVGHLVAGLVPEPVHILTFVSRVHGRFEDWSPALAPGRTPFAGPVRVLVDGGTASAAESFAYALQSLGRATIVGGPTVGIANPVEDFPVSGGFVVSVSTAAPVDPRTGTNWDGPGVVADEPAAG